MYVHTALRKPYLYQSMQKNMVTLCMVCGICCAPVNPGGLSAKGGGVFTTLSLGNALINLNETLGGYGQNRETFAESFSLKGFGLRL